jgi:serine/threonine protein kinase/WD40 repeat protein
MDDSTLSEIWTNVYPDIDLNQGSKIQSYSPKSNDDKLRTTLIIEPGDCALVDKQPDFEIIEQIAEGGMGCIFRAIQSNLRRDVAIKVCQPNGGKAGSRAQFLSEAQVTAWLDHPNIVPAHQLIERPDGEVQLAMKLVGGRSWEQLLKTDQPWIHEDHIKGHLDILVSICHAVAFAHSKGIAHLDLKPDNVMIGDFGEVLVLDWGLAVELTGAKSRAAARALLKSDFNKPSGTPRYMAPELARGAGDEIGAWTDCYLLGGMLYKILTGKAPNRGKTLLKTLLNAIEETIADIPENISSELAEIAKKALSKPILERFQTALEFQEAIQGYLTHRQSLILSSSAQETLDLTGSSVDQESSELYKHLGRAFAGFEQALELWSDNKAAMEGKRQAILQTANHGLEGGDFGLVGSQISLLDSDDESAEKLKNRLRVKLLDHKKQQQRQRAIRYSLFAAIGVVVLCLSVGFILVSKSEDAALRALADADSERKKTAAALAVSKEARKKTVEALEDSKKNLSQAYFLGGRFYLESKDMPAAELMLANSIALSDSVAARGALLQARLANVTAWSMNFENQRLFRIFFKDENLFALTCRVFNKNKSKGGYTQIQFFRLIKPDRPDLRSSWEVKTIQPLDSDLGDIIRFHPDKKHQVYIKGQTDGAINIDHNKYWTLWDWNANKKLRAALPKEIEAARAPGQEFITNILKNAVEIRGLNGGKTKIFEVDFQPDISAVSGNGQIFAVAGQLQISIFDTATLKRRCNIRLRSKQRSDKVCALSLSADGRFVSVNIQSEKTLRVWSTEDGHLEHKFDVGAVVSDLSFCKKRPVLFVLTEEGLHIRHLGEEAVRSQLSNTKTGVMTPAKKSEELYVYNSEQFLAWNLKTLSSTVRYKDLGDISGFGEHPSKNLIALSADGYLRIQNSKTGKEIARFRQRMNPEALKYIKEAKTPEARKLLKPLIELVNKLSAYKHLLFVPDGPFLVALGRDRGTIFDFEKKLTTGAIDWSGLRGLFDVSMHPAGKTLATYHKGSRKVATVCLWELPKGRLIKTFVAHKAQPSSLRFSPDGKYLATVTQDGAFIGLWSPDGEKRFILQNTPHYGDLFGLTFSHDSRLLLTSDNQGLICFWDLEKPKLLGQIQGHRKSIRSLQMSSDGARLFSQERKTGLIKVWDFDFVKRVLMNASGKELLEEAQQRTELKLQELLQRAR